MEFATTVVACGLWVVAVGRWQRVRNTAGQRALTHSVVALAICATLFIPGVSHWINETLPFPHAASLMMFAAGAFAALALIGAIRFMSLPERQARAGRVARRTMVGLAVAGVAITLFVGQPSADSISSPWPDSSEWPMYAFWALWLGFVIVTCTWISINIFRRSQLLPPSRLRLSLQLLTGSAASGAIYGVSKAILVIAAAKAVSLPWLTIISQAGAILMMGLIVVAIVLVALPGSRRLQALRDQKSARLILPMWQTLRAVDPAMQLTSSNAQVELYRMVVECRDWMRQLRFVLPATAWAEANAAAAALADERDVTATATAGWIEAALVARKLGAVPQRPSPMPPTAQDLDAEIDFLTAVAQVPASTAKTVADAIRTVDVTGTVPKRTGPTNRPARTTD